MIAARNAFLMGGSSAPTARDYVQDGLIAMWDGIENAGWGVHDTAATTWIDLVGARQFVLTQYGAFDDTSFVSSSVSGHSAATLNASFSGIATLQFCKLTTAAVSDAQGAWMMEATINSNTMGLGIRTARNGQSPNTPIGSLLIRGNSYQTNNPICLSANEVAPYQADTVTAILDGGMLAAGYVRTASASVLIGQNNISANMARLGCERFGRWWRGHIYGIRMYSRVLTAAEVAANYAIDAARFGL